MNIYTSEFGKTATGETAHLYTLVNDSGMRVSITDFGGAIVSLLAPDRYGRLSDVIFGYDSLADYEAADGYLGALVGRFANRIAGASFALDGETYDTLHVNDGANHLHGGKRGFSKILWSAETKEGIEALHLILTYRSPDGEEGYPGNMDVTVTYTLDNEGALSLHYTAVTDKACPINLTNHAYFNLGGYASGTILGHELWLDAESYLATDGDLIPTGELVPVDGTPFDFRTPKAIGRDFFADNADLRLAGGYDHCFNFTDWRGARAGGKPVLRARVTDPVSGRCMEMYTNQPCVQLYTANFLCNSRFPLRGGLRQQKQTALCLETQKMPDAPHHQGEADYTDCILRPGETYNYATIYRFGTV